MAIIDQKIQMHALLQEMGREIVRSAFPTMPKRWSRLWDFNDIFCVMQNDRVSYILLTLFCPLSVFLNLNKHMH